MQPAKEAATELAAIEPKAEPKTAELVGEPVIPKRGCCCCHPHKVPETETPKVVEGPKETERTQEAVSEGKGVQES